jgi:outer membrane murein-binding lipoprotein Lpp
MKIEAYIVLWFLAALHWYAVLRKLDRLEKRVSDLAAEVAKLEQDEADITTKLAELGTEIADLKSQIDPSLAGRLEAVHQGFLSLLAPPQPPPP